MSHKYKPTLPGPLAEQLEELAAAAELAPSTLAGQFVASEVSARRRRGQGAPAAPASSEHRARQERLAGALALSPMEETPTGARTCGGR
jgi:hypothetical protein